MGGIHFFGDLSLRQRLRFAIVLLVFLTAVNCENAAVAQTQQPSSSQLERRLRETSQEPSDVVRVRTELVQTSVAVFGKNGKFVDNLKSEDFELRVDGKPQAVLFFDRVVNGVAESPSKGGAGINRGLIAPEDKSRTVLFFVDDFHLSSESIGRVRKMLSHYIEEEMGPNDEAVVASASGQIGFLQQLTGEKEVLRAAVERLKYRPQGVMDNDRPRMSPFQALAIQRGDNETMAYFTGLLLNDELAALARRNPQLAGDVAVRRTQSRANRIARQIGFVANQTLTALNSAVRSSTQIAGRKLVVFISDGFFINNQTADITNRLRTIADAAVHAGAVLYTIQASGLNTSFPDASSDAGSIGGDGPPRVPGEDTALQDALAQLAADTGGKALLNANDLTGTIKNALRESNDYYLLAWRPETIASRAQEFQQIEVSVKGHPELSVLVQRGYFKEEQTAAVIPAKAQQSTRSNKTQAEDLAAAIKGKLSGSPLQTSLMANYQDVPNHGARLSVLMQVGRATAAMKNAGKPGAVDIAGVIYDVSGKVIGSFVENLKPENSETQHLNYLNQFDIKPGLYQVRVAARDSSGATGMAMQWVPVPNLSNHKLALSSLLIGERELSPPAGAPDALQLQKAQLKIDKRFAQNSRLRFVTYIYNAAPSLSLNARVDIFRGNKPVFSTPARVVDTNGVADPARIPYAGELSLASFSKGNYKMRVTVIDLNAKAYASQETTFAIE